MKTEIELSLIDQDGEEKTVDVLIEVTEYGINILPVEIEDRYNGIFERSIFVEFYAGTLRVLAWDGTQEDPVMTQGILQT